MNDSYVYYLQYMMDFLVYNNLQMAAYNVG